MEVIRDHSAPTKALPSMLGGVQAAGRFAVFAAMLTIGGDRVPDAPICRPASVRIAQEKTPTIERIDPNTLKHGETLSLIGKKLRIPREGRPDLLVDIGQHDGELEVTVNGKTFRIQDTMNVAVGKSIVSAELCDGVLTITTTEFGTAKVDRSDVDDILDELAKADTTKPAVAKVSTNFAPEGFLLTNAINASRYCRGWKEGDKETYDIGFLCIHDTSDTALAMAK